MFLRRIFFLLLTTCASVFAVAQPSVVMRYDTDRLQQDDSLEVVYSIYGAPASALVNPNFTGWRVLRGPWQRSISVTENGLTQQVAEVHYMLQPLRSGQLLIPAAALRHNGELAMSNYASVEVVSQNTNSNAPDFSYDAYVARPDEDLKRKLTENAFLRIRTNRQTLYEGESLIAEYMLYSRVSLEASVTKRPGFNGFSSIDLKFDTSSSGYTTEAYNGKVYRVFGVRKVQLAALRAGKLKLDAFELEAKANFAMYQEGFASLGADKVVQQVATLRSNEPVINVIPLPEENKPATFSGAVGEFNISSHVVVPGSKAIAVSQKAELVVAIGGKGHWNLINTPDIIWPDGLTAYAPTITEALDSQQVPVQGVRHFHFPFVPEKTGDYIIPGVAFSYFNPVTRRYMTLQSQPLTITVKKAPLKTALIRVRETFTNPVSYVLWFSILAAVLVVLYFFIRKTTVAKKEKPEVNKPLGFYGQMLQGYLQHVLHKKVWTQHEAGKMKDMLENYLRSEESSAEQRVISGNIISHCNNWIYAPEGSEPNDNEEVINLLNKLEATMQSG